MAGIAASFNALDHWLKAVGLAPHFPRLDRVGLSGEPGSEVPIDDRFYFGQPHEELIEAAIGSLLRPGIANLAPTGHGITTLARYVYDKSVADAVKRSLVPVRFSLEDVLEPVSRELMAEVLEIADPAQAPEPPDTDTYGRLLWASIQAQKSGLEQAPKRLAQSLFGSVDKATVKRRVEDAITGAVVTSLVTEPWELVIGNGAYAALVGAPTNRAEDLVQARRALSALLRSGGDPVAAAEDQRARLGQPWPVLLRTLWAEGQVRLSIQLDLSPSPAGRSYRSSTGREHLSKPYEKALRQVAAAIKNIDEETKDTPFNVALFLSVDALRTYESQVTKKPERREFPAYSSLDVFTILAVHFRRSTGGKKDRKDDLAAVLDSSLIAYEEGAALSTMTHKLRVELEQMRPENLRFQVSPGFSGIFGFHRSIDELEEWQRETDERLAEIEARLERWEREGDEGDADHQ
ncbi:MAG TPA: hypothetical protein VGO60_08395 [Iamia sp.]|jgi:hypothetical protein|nr:hypothetical protein [Iamia sp.]